MYLTGGGEGDRDGDMTQHTGWNRVTKTCSDMSYDHPYYRVSWFISRTRCTAHFLLITPLLTTQSMCIITHVVFSLAYWDIKSFLKGQGTLIFS